MCREFPRDPIDLIALPGCGYTFLDNKGRDMMPALREMALERAESEGFEDVVEFLKKEIRDYGSHRKKEGIRYLENKGP